MPWENICTHSSKNGAGKAPQPEAAGGMRPEEVFRLSDLSKEQFLKLMASRSEGYSKELYMRKV